MPSLVLELQTAAMDSSRKVDELLRMALAVATKLRVGEFKEWCERELRGYQATDDVPPYRKVRGELKAVNPVRGLIPVMVTDSELSERLTHRPVHQSVSELAHLLSRSDGGGTLHMAIPQETLLAVFGDTQEFHLGIIPTLIISSSELHGIVAAVRDTILQWSLRLERDGILGDGMTFSREEVRKATSATYHIQNFSGVLGNVTDSNVQVRNYNAVHGELKRLGVSQEARNELENILDELAKASPSAKKSIARRGVEWLGKHGQTLGALSDTIRGWIEPFVT